MPPWLNGRATVSCSPTFFAGIAQWQSNCFVNSRLWVRIPFPAIQVKSGRVNKQQVRGSNPRGGSLYLKKT